jgi:hypothetical protein
MNKKKILFRTVLGAILVFLCLQPSQAMEVGILFGPTFFRFDSPDLTWISRMCFSAGAYVNFRLGRDFLLQPELRWTTISSDSTISMEYGDYESCHQNVTLRKAIHCIELPLILRFSPSHGGKIKPNIQAGVYTALGVLGKDFLETNGQSHTEGIGDELCRFHAGLLAGVGIDVLFFKYPVHLSVQGRVALTPPAVNYLRQSIKSSGFLISLEFGLWDPNG